MPTVNELAPVTSIPSRGPQATALVREHARRLRQRYDSRWSAASGSLAATERSVGQLALTLPFPIPTPHQDAIDAEPRSKLAPLGRTVATGHDDFGPQSTSTDELPPARDHVARLAMTYAEIMIGLRPVSQLSRWLSTALYQRLVRQCGGHGLNSGARTARRRPAALLSVRVTHPADGVVEAVAVVRIHSRPQAVALRLEGWDGRWICSHIDVC